ncbi:hypothetical protein NKG94_48925 [Micromonospora sp. M12]
MSDAQPSTNQQKVSDGGADKTGAEADGGRDDDWGGDDWGGVDDQSGRDGKDGKDGKDSKNGKDGDEKDRTRQVPCDTDRLIQAITFANNEDGGVLELARGCTYTLTRNQDGNGLPVITENITLKGEHTTIGREATADYFRILNVGAGGHLTLKGLSIRGGQTLQSPITVDPATVWAPYSALAARSTLATPVPGTEPGSTPARPRQHRRRSPQPRQPPRQQSPQQRQRRQRRRPSPQQRQPSPQRRRPSRARRQPWPQRTQRRPPSR